MLAWARRQQTMGDKLRPPERHALCAIAPVMRLEPPHSTEVSRSQGPREGPHRSAVM